MKKPPIIDIDFSAVADEPLTIAIDYPKHVLSLEEIRKLPQAGDYDSGIYFLWLKDELQYIGMSVHIADRLNHHAWAEMYGTHRSRKTNQIPFDKHTALAMERGQVSSTGIKDLMTALETQYIVRYAPPFNTLHATKRRAR